MYFRLGLLTVGYVLASKADDIRFQRYCAKYGKHYNTPEEYEMRKQLYTESLHDIEIINSSNDNTFKADNNVFSDWTHEEYKKLLGTWTKKNKLQMVPLLLTMKCCQRA